MVNNKSCDREKYVVLLHQESLRLGWKRGYARNFRSSPRELPVGDQRNAVKTGR